MKKLFALLTTGVVSMAAMATTYTGTLTVVSAGTSTTQNDVTATIEGNTVTLNGVTSLCTANTNNGITTLVHKDAAAQVVAHYGYDGKYAVINMTLADGTVYNFQNVGNAFQLPNADFETWTADSGEAQHWHGFKSAYGSVAGMASSTFGKSTDVRNGATGSYCGVVGSTEINLFIAKIVANGTMTNGQLKAGSTTATSTNNHSEMDRKSTNVDNDGNPFYMALPARPDAVKIWLKFVQGTANKTYPYATFNAVAYDDTSVEGVTYYQDPEDKAYSNVVARAKNNTIAVCDWTEFNIPFAYEAPTASNKNADAILITMSTNATPGQGSKGDQLFMDDLSLVYNAEITSIFYAGDTLSFVNGVCTVEGTFEQAPTAEEFTVNFNGAGAVRNMMVETTDDSYIVYVVVASADLLTTDMRTIVFPRSVAPVRKFGDVNGDGIVDVDDINIVIESILSGKRTDNADVNGDGAIDVDDISAIIDVMLNN